MCGSKTRWLLLRPGANKAEEGSYQKASQLTGQEVIRRLASQPPEAFLLFSFCGNS
jgi:hypothetical protein